MADMHKDQLDALRAEEEFVADTQLLLHEMMVAKGVTRADLAARLGVSRARVSQLFSSECRNFTVRLLARAMHAVGERPSLSCAWVEQREGASRARRLADLVADPAINVVAMWSPDGVIVPPEDRVGACRSDPRLKSFLKSIGRARNDNDRLRAAA